MNSTLKNLLTDINTAQSAKNDERYVIEGEYSPSNRVGIADRAENLIPDVNDECVNYEDGYTNNGETVFGTGDNDTVDGEATIISIRGNTEYDNNGQPSYVNVVSNTSVRFNLFDPAAGCAHVVKSDDVNNGLCVYGTGVTSDNKIVFSETSDFASTTAINIAEKTNTTGETYLQFAVPSDGYVKLANSNGAVIAAPSDLCISNVWGGYRVKQHPAYEAETVEINSLTYFADGMKSIKYGGDTVVYDEMKADKYYKRVQAYTFAATPSLTYATATTGTTPYNIYYMSLPTAPVAGGYAEIGGVNKFDVSTIALSSSSNPASDCMYLHNSSSTYRIYFAIAQSEDSTTTTTYSLSGTDDATYTITDAQTFADALAHYGTLYTSSDGTATGEMTAVNEYDSEISNYYYAVVTTNTHGLNGQAIIDAVGDKVMNYQIKSMDTASYTGTAISPALDWTYKMGDFGTEMLTLASGFPATPIWIVSYPLNIKETVQTLPQNYVSLDSVENLLHQVGDNQGFDFDSVIYDSGTGQMKINGLVDTKEIIDKLTINLSAGSVLANKIIYNDKTHEVWIRVSLYNATITSTTDSFKLPQWLQDKFGNGDYCYPFGFVATNTNSSISVVRTGYSAGHSFWQMKLSTTFSNKSAGIFCYWRFI